MADERIDIDVNYKGVAAGVTNDADKFITMLRVDPVTKRLLVDVNTTGTQVQDNEAVSASDYGMLVLGTDGSNYQVLHTDSSGDLQLDVLTLPAITIAAAQTLATVTTVSTVTSVTAIANALPAGTNAIGKLAANSGVDIGDVDVTSISTGTNAIGRVGHDITGIGHGVTTVTTAGTDVALAASTPCKRVDIQAQTDNTSGIAVGGSGVDAVVATGTGIYLNPGDIYSLEIDNLADVYIDSLVNGEGCRFTYYT